MAQEFKIYISPAEIEDLQQRLANTKWPGEIDNSDWKLGTNLEYLKDLCMYWQTKFNWKKQEEHLNALSHFKTTVDGTSFKIINV